MAMTSLEIVFVIALVAKLLAELVLEALNRAHVAKLSGAMPEEFEGVMSDENYEKSTRYTLAALSMWVNGKT